MRKLAKYGLRLVEGLIITGNEQVENKQIENEQIEDGTEDEQIEDEQIENEQTNNKNASPDTVDVWKKSPTTRSLILQALAHNISRLVEIADFAGVDPSTAHYHLRNLIREGRVTKISWGQYTFSGGKFLRNSGKTFEDSLRNFSQSSRADTGTGELHPVEKNILMDILSKENKYEQFSERELARRSNITRYITKKYTRKLEKKKLIKIKKESTQLTFVPTELAVKGLTEFFQSEKTGSKIDSESSKIQPENQPAENLEMQPVVGSPDVLETFDDYIAWQQKNAHRFSHWINFFPSYILYKSRSWLRNYTGQYPTFSNLYKTGPVDWEDLLGCHNPQYIHYYPCYTCSIFIYKSCVRAEEK